MVNKNVCKTLSIITLVIMFLIMNITSVFATANTVKSNEILNLERKLTNAENKLVKYLEKNIGKKDTKLIIEDFFKYELNNTEKLSKDDVIRLNEIDNQDKENKFNSYNNKFYSNKIRKTVQIGQVIITFYKNGTFSVEDVSKYIYTNRVDLTTSSLVASVPSSAITSTSGTVWGQAYKDYYSWVGIYVFTVAVGSSFAYNGQYASYNGSFKAYYLKGPIPLWQVSDWTSGHGPAGNKYEAYCSGYFHIGFEYQGVGWVIQDFYIQHRVTCSPTGQITPSYIII